MSIASQPPLAAGATLAGKYRVERLLGESGIGLVFLASDLVREGFVVLRLLPRGAALSPRAASIFSSETSAVARLQSSHVGRVLDAGVADDGKLYLAREYFEGTSLARRVQLGGPLDLSSATKYAIQACEGLAEAHSKGLFHSDVKPYNLFLVEEAPGRGTIKIVDFGLSQFAFADASSIVTAAMIGYMSPEQLRSASVVDHRTDVWSLGATLYELLTGRAAFDATQSLPRLVTAILDGPPPNARATRADVPPGLAAVIERCLAKDPRHRFQKMGELARALLPFAPAEARDAAELAASWEPAVRRMPFVPTLVRSPAPPPAVDPPPLRPPTPATPGRRPDGSSLAAVTRAIFGSGEQSRAPASQSVTKTLFGLGDSRPAKGPIPSLFPVARTLVGVHSAPPALATAPRDALKDAPKTQDQEYIGDLPRHRTPSWLGVAALSTAAAGIFAAVLFSAPDASERARRVGASSIPPPAPAVAVAPPEKSTASSSAPNGVASADVPDVVALLVRASPAAARIVVDGVVLEGNPTRALFPKGKETHRITVSAEGYDSKSEDVPAAADTVVDVSLNRRPNEGPWAGPWGGGGAPHVAARPLETRDPTRVP